MQTTRKNRSALVATKDPKTPLRMRQQKALLALASGQRIAPAAAAAGVGRERLSHWIHNDPWFGEQLAKMRAQQEAESKAALRSLLDKTVAALDSALVSKDADRKLKAAALVLRHTIGDRANVDLSVIASRIDDDRALTADELADLEKHLAEHRRSLDADTTTVEPAL